MAVNQPRGIFSGGGVGIAHGNVGAYNPHKMYPAHQSCPHQVAKSRVCMRVSRQESSSISGMLHLAQGRHTGVPGFRGIVLFSRDAAPDSRKAYRSIRIQRNRPGFNRAVTHVYERHSEATSYRVVTYYIRSIQLSIPNSSDTRISIQVYVQVSNLATRGIIIICNQRLYIGQKWVKRH